MFFSPSSQQALRALIHLARENSDQPVLVRDIALAEAIPHPYLCKLLHRLRNRGIVKSTRGPGGGYTLARPAECIVLTDVVETFEGTQTLDKQCILGLDECNEANPCALHERWRSFREEFEAHIGSMTLHDVTDTLAGKRERKRAGSSGKPTQTSRSQRKAPRKR